MARDPLPSLWNLAAAPDGHPDDIWAVGADLEPGTILAAYRVGLFPMRAGELLGWWSPALRGVIPVAGHVPSRSLRRAAARFAIRVDTSFDAVIQGCRDPVHRPETWIDEDFVRAYSRLHEFGWAHSIEAWDEDGLAGGLYGIGIGGLFAAESMFHLRGGASKAALLGLIRFLATSGDADRRLIDVQWLTPHLASVGAVALPRRVYHRRLASALTCADAFTTAGRCRS